MQRRFAVWIWLPVIAGLLAACGTQVATPAPVTIRIGGSTALQPALVLWTRAFHEAHPHIHFDILSGGTHLGRAWLAQGRIDIAASAWEPGGAEGAPPGIQVIPVAMDGIALIVHPHNPITQTTLAQLQDIYAGHILTWREVGGEEAEIIVLSREDGSGTRDAFEAMVMGQKQVTLAALVMPSGVAMVDYVANHPYAIGYTGTARLDERVKALALEGALPGLDNVERGAYPLRRTLYLLAPASPSAEVQRFLDFVRSPAGQSLIASTYVPIAR